LQFQRIEHPNKRSDYTVQNTEVDGHVFVEYNRSLTLDADRTIYHTSSPSFRSGQGHLQAFAADQSKRCRIQSKDDTIHAHAIDFDLAHAVLMLQKPEGSLREALGTLHNRDLHFSCDHALWDHPKKMLQLSGNVLIDKAALGELINDKEVLIKQGNQGITSMIARGSSALKFQNQPNMIQRKLVCHRKLVIDHTKMHASCESRSDGSTLSIEEQVSYEEGEIAVYADSASLDYAVDEAHLQPMRVTLKGHVRIFTGTVEEPKRLGLADWVTYSSTTGSFIFGANPGHHVLFLDMQEDTKISAQEVHLTLASSGNQEKITGIGNVQFSFSADEETLLHNLFHTIHDIKTR
jgi:lipopolysaccharide export system protein LptA